MTTFRCQCALIATGVVLLAGCGSSSNTSSVVPASTPTQTTTPAQATGAATGTTGTSPSAGAASTQLSQAIQRCKQAISSSTRIPADAKAKLQQLCDEAANGNPATLKKTAAQVCQQLVEETVPASQRQADLAKCPKA